MGNTVDIIYIFMWCNIGTHIQITSKQPMFKTGFTWGTDRHVPGARVVWIKAMVTLFLVIWDKDTLDFVLAIKPYWPLFDN